jgi:hypothetical protein
MASHFVPPLQTRSRLLGDAFHRRAPRRALALVDDMNRYRF